LTHQLLMALEVAVDRVPSLVDPYPWVLWAFAEVDPHASKVQVVEEGVHARQVPLVLPSCLVVVDRDVETVIGQS
jgi:hypothetical protein